MRKIMFLLLGGALIGGGYIYGFHTPSVSSEDVAQCMSNIETVYGDNADEVKSQFDCTEIGIVNMMHAQVNNLGAEEAADLISGGNRRGILDLIIACAMMGGGIGALGAGFGLGRKKA